MSQPRKIEIVLRRLDGCSFTWTPTSEIVAQARLNSLLVRFAGARVEETAIDDQLTLIVHELNPVESDGWAAVKAYQ